LQNFENVKPIIKQLQQDKNSIKNICNVFYNQTNILNKNIYIQNNIKIEIKNTGGKGTDGQKTPNFK